MRPPISPAVPQHSLRHAVPGRPNLGQILLKQGRLTESELATAIHYHEETGCRIGEALKALNFCTDSDIARAVAEQLEIPFVDLAQTTPSPECVAMIPREVALVSGVLPIRMEQGALLVAARDPYDVTVDEALHKATRLPIRVAAAPEGQLRDMLIQYYSEQHFESVETPTSGVTELSEPGEEEAALVHLLAASEDVSTVQVVNTLINDSIRRGASDLHIEPAAGSVRIRYRLDGRLHTIVTLRPTLLQSMVARIKVLSGMDLAESRVPQDGAMRVRVDARSFELRVSTLPGIYGEVVVIRILCQDPVLQEVGELGFEPDMLAALRGLLARRQGLLLVTGPTGSGKTTSLYAFLGRLNVDEVNIVTVEDPVEIRLPWINQVQVNEKAGRTFPMTLRAMLRQDPDIIMVGEMRDQETAEIACRAALTGHLVLSTLHTQDALGALPRLYDMGVARYIVAAAVIGVLAQRLVRRVCSACAVDYTPPETLLHALQAEFGELSAARFRRGTGCEMCQGTGCRGRLGVYELLVVDGPLREQFDRTDDPAEVMAYLRERGFRSMEDDGFRKAARGLIPPEEIVELGMRLAARYQGGVPEPAEVELLPASPLPSLPPRQAPLPRRRANGKPAAIRTAPRKPGKP